jgi:hypothetical protein
MRYANFLFALAPLSLLAACGGAEEGDARGTDISVNGKNEDGGTVAIKADGETGKVSVKVPGFDANVTLPKVMLDNGDFELEGVKLYPGSKVSTVNVNADSSGAGKKAVIKIGFIAPADIEKVRAWFANGFADKSVKATATATGFTGRTDDGGGFTMTLAPNGQNSTTGTVDIIEEDGWNARNQPKSPTPPSPPPAP